MKVFYINIWGFWGSVISSLLNTNLDPVKDATTAHTNAATTDMGECFFGIALSSLAFQYSFQYSGTCCVFLFRFTFTIN